MTADDLRVLVLARAVHPWHGVGGLERHVHDLVRHLLARGVRLTLVSPPPRRGANREAFRDARLTTCFVPYRTFPFAGRRGTTIVDRSTAYPIFGWRAGRLAQRLVEQGRAQIVHGLGASALGYARARARDRFETVPLVLNPQGLEEFGATDPARAPLKRLAYRPLQAAVRACARAADRVLATDEALVPVVLEHLPVTPGRVQVVPNAVDLERIDAYAARGADHIGELRRTVGGGEDEALFVAAGRLESNKGFHVLIEALAKLAAGRAEPRWRLVIIGDGPRRRPLERQVRAAGLGARIRLIGRVPDETVHAWYAAATVFVHPTLYEGSSLVTLEAMAHRRAVVATAAGGIPDKVTPGVTGWLVPPGDAPALTAALRSALSNHSRLIAMGRAGREVVERRFSWRAATDRLLAVYRDVLAGRSRGA
ncbi:MAG: glycosyltransferase family 4 protein [Acidobacteria bacterium]|nr:glycosyltransferase family 4 protein [Acidobacteriota bacterium]MYH30049.1 glycosyltransferase family 4 protein [Acidobacteriota bacterium]MYK88660.1 glycosyltransferase family 4 protein [Acidobacteriota bacterium]